GYRRSNLASGSVVVAATFSGRADAPAAIAARIAQVVVGRGAHHRVGQTAGPLFANQPDDSAGRLIEAAGCKGLRVGGAVVSEKHANFFVAEPGALAAHVYGLMELVRSRVHEATGVQLEPELHLIGF